ncbi:hypothetical protein [Butyrivibrio fibrisolvens]|uniref:hypothetical protein n=1 Tax=Butyrivibrio fibrisolvens TaxID=831 RepID=UPI0003B5CF48|nr:hypothetical protein [Butyrivibrio fibrisolvens]
MYLANVINGKKANYILDKQRAEARQKGFIWRAYLLAYSSESAELYNNITQKWNELDAITGHSLAFFIANEDAATFMHMGSEMRHDRYCPRGIRSIAETNSAFIEMFKEEDCFEELNIPCLKIDNLIGDKDLFFTIKLKNDSDIVSIMKYISIRTSKYLKDAADIKKVIDEEHLRRLENYYNLRRTIIRVSVEAGECSTEVLSLFKEFEETQNSYAEERLIKMWHQVVDSYHKAIYRDKNGSMIYKLIELRYTIPDFYVRFKRYEDLVNEMDFLIEDLNSSIRNIDVDNCKDDAIKYAKQLIVEADTILSKESVEISLKRDIINDLNMQISGDYEIERSILDKIHESKAIVALDDYGRLMTLIGIITSLGKLIGNVL